VKKLLWERVVLVQLSRISDRYFNVIISYIVIDVMLCYRMIRLHVRLVSWLLAHGDVACHSAT